MIETALTIGLFTSIIFSLFDFGYIMYMHQTVLNRLESAARYASLYPTDTTAIKNYVVYNAATGSGAGLFGLTTDNVTVTRTGSGTNDDRINLTVSGFSFQMNVLARSATSKAITVSLPVEPN